MAYGDKYTASFKDIDGNTITIAIKKKDYAGESESLLLSENPCIISTPTKNYLNSIYGTGCTINFINTSGKMDKYDDLYGSPELEFYVLVKRSTYILFEGFVVSNMHTQQIRVNSQVSVVASNRLSELKDHISDLLYDDELDMINVWDMIVDCLHATGLELPIYCKNSMGFESPDNYFDRKLFINKEKYENSYVILEEILKSWNSRVYYCNGRWVVDRKRDISGYSTYAITGTSVGSLTHSVINIDQQNQLSLSGRVTYERGISELNLILASDRYTNLVVESFAELNAISLVRKFNWYTNPRPPIVSIYTNPHTSGNLAWGIHYGTVGADLGTTLFENTSIYTVAPFKLEEGTKINIAFGFDTSIYKPITIAGIHGGQLIPITFDDWGVKWKIMLSTGQQPGLGNLWIYWDEDESEFKASKTPPGDGRIRGEFLMKSLSESKERPFLARPSISFTLTQEMVDLIRTVLHASWEVEPKLFHLRIDFYPLQSFLTDEIIEQGSSNPLNWLGGNLNEQVSDWGTAFGDVIVSEDAKPMDNVITGTISTGFTNKLEIPLKLYDSLYHNYRNAIYADPYNDGEIFDPYMAWLRRNDAHSSPELTLQHFLIYDLLQQFSEPRRRIDVDVKMKSTTMPTLGNVYRHSHFIEGNLLNFIATGIEINVKMNAFRLSLHEFKDYNDYDIEEGDFDVTPKALTLDLGANAFTYNVVSDGYWTATRIYTQPGLYLPWLEFPLTGESGGLFPVTVKAMGSDYDGAYCTVTFKRGTQEVVSVITRSGTADTLDISPTGKTVDWDGGSFTLEILSNRAWVLNVDYLQGNTGWISSAKYSGTGDDSFLITTSATNPTPSWARIRVTAGDIVKICGVRSFGTLMEE